MEERKEGRVTNESWQSMPWWWSRWGRVWRLIRLKWYEQVCCQKTQNHKEQNESVAVRRTRKKGKFLSVARFLVENSSKKHQRRALMLSLLINWLRMTNHHPKAHRQLGLTFGHAKARERFDRVAQTVKNSFSAPSYLDISSWAFFLWVRKVEWSEVRQKTLFNLSTARPPKCSSQREWRIPFHVKVCDFLLSWRPAWHYPLMRKAQGENCCGSFPSTCSPLPWTILLFGVCEGRRKRRLAMLSPNLFLFDLHPPIEGSSRKHFRWNSCLVPRRAATKNLHILPPLLTLTPLIFIRLIRCLSFVQPRNWHTKHQARGEVEYLLRKHFFLFLAFPTRDLSWNLHLRFL